LPHRFSHRSYEKLVGVRPELVSIAALAIERSTVDFMVTEGVRTQERQQELYDAGATRTLNSKHLHGRAIDVAAIVGTEVRWDWPLYERISQAFKSAAQDLGIAIVWGGDWASFPDGPHYELTDVGVDG
jgi:peptidoglycan L-alanyl-D-glutamate endopeptidase CwlK